jgi:hypothetical protein
VQLGSIGASATSTLYNSVGTSQSTYGFSVAAGAEYDLLVHDMVGRNENEIGWVCTTHNSGAGNMDGRMVYYKPSTEAGASYDDFEFAFAMPYTNGIAGTQFVTWNTFNPSYNAADSGKLVANWVQLTNRSGSTLTGTLYFYDISNTLIASQAMSIADSARVDVAAHENGTNKVGIVEWRPDNSSAVAQLRNVRYLYDTATTFFTAFQVEGIRGSGEKLVAPLDTTNGQSAILEIANVSNASTTVAVAIYSSGGTERYSTTLTLAAKESYHLIADGYLLSQKGLAVIDGAATESTIAVAMHYGRDASGSMQYMYGVQAKEPQGMELKSSYNTFLQQGCEGVLLNPTALDQSANVAMVRSDSTVVVSLGSVTVNVPANGRADIDLCAYDTADNYGVVSIQAASNNALVGHVIREGKNTQYVFPTPLRQ